MANFPSDILTINATEVVDSAGAISVGFTFTVSTSTNALGIRWYATRAMTANAYLWSAAGGILGSVTGQAATTGWNTFTFTSPIAMSSGSTYVVGVEQDAQTGNVFYTATTSVSSKTSGGLSTSTTAGQYLYNPSPIGHLPDQGTSDFWFGMDVVTGATVPNTGTLAATLRPVTGSVSTGSAGSTAGALQLEDGTGVIELEDGTGPLQLESASSDRDVQILATTVPVSGWSTNGLSSPWMTSTAALQLYDATPPATAEWTTTSPTN